MCERLGACLGQCVGVVLWVRDVGLEWLVQHGPQGDQRPGNARSLPQLITLTNQTAQYMIPPNPK